LGRNNSAVLVREGTTIQGILTRSDLLQFLMAR
jgi:predicted transcriptional regulator